MTAVRQNAPQDWVTVTSKQFTHFRDSTSTQKIRAMVKHSLCESGGTGPPSVTAFVDKHMAWLQAVDAIAKSHSSSWLLEPWERHANVAATASTLAAMALLAEDEGATDIDNIALCGWLDLYAMRMVNDLPSLTGFLADAPSLLRHEVADAQIALNAVRATSSGRGTRLNGADGRWPAWGALHEPAARAAGQAAASAWFLERCAGRLRSGSTPQAAVANRGTGDVTTESNPWAPSPSMIGQQRRVSRDGPSVS
jgi:hypothetical protein